MKSRRSTSSKKHTRVRRTRRVRGGSHGVKKSRTSRLKSKAKRRSLSRRSRRGKIYGGSSEMIQKGIVKIFLIIDRLARDGKTIRFVDFQRYAQNLDKIAENLGTPLDKLLKIYGNDFGDTSKELATVQTIFKNETLKNQEEAKYINDIIIKLFTLISR